MKKFFGKIGRGMKKNKKLTIFLIIIIVLLITAAILVPKFFGKKENGMQAAKETTVSLSKMDLTSSVSATGTIESAKSKTVSADVTNVKVKSVKVSEGDTVKKGQTLVTFDESDLQDALTEAKDNLSDAKTQAASELSSAQRKLSEAKSTYSTQNKKTKSTVVSAKSAYEQAKKEYKNAKSAEEKQKAKETLDKAKTTYEQAVSERENTNKQNQSNIDSAKEAVTNARTNNKKTLREAQKSVTEASETLAACAVTAPMSGTVTAVGVEAGDSYSGGDMFEISDCTDLQVSTTVSEYDITKVKKGQKVVILTDATDEEEIEGKITYVALTTGSSSLSSSSTEAGGNAGGSNGSSTSSSSDGYEVRIQILKENKNLRVGMTAKCSIILEEASDVYAVPYDAIHQNTSGDSVIYVKDSSTNTKKEITVTKGMESDYYVEVTGDGLSEGLMVILPSDTTSSKSSSDSDKSSSGLSDMMGGMSGGGGRGGAPGGNGGGPSGGGPGM